MRTQPNTQTTRRKRSSALNSAVLIYNTVVLVLTNIRGGSRNAKTGDMIQSWVFDRTKLTERVFGAKCEECPMVSQCYVMKGTQAHNSVRRATLKALGLLSGNTSYKVTTLESVLPMLAGRPIRLGSYGDPSAIPLDDLRALVSASSGHTGYTHFWRTSDPDYSEFLMASVEDLASEMLAQSLGYRTYRVLRKQESQHEVSERSILCLEKSAGLSCADCLVCSGNTKPNAKNIYIYEH
jgi:hypothetical protein